MRRLQFDFSGIVQGVGFRPALYRRAAALNLTGTIQNTPKGVTATLQGEAVDRFLEDFRAHLPPLATLEEITTIPQAPKPDERDLLILSTPATLAPAYTHVPPDSAPCAACEADLKDPVNRRFRYPFISCSDCGPRFSIIRTLPYDRPHTTLADFPLCAACEAEYRDPNNRRYHAQPIGCHECGPTLALYDTKNRPIAHQDGAIMQAVEALKAGQIVALKGVGGFQLLCDGRNDRAVRTLRQRKQRPDKPFALLVPSLDAAKKQIALCKQACALLESPARPIVIGEQQSGCDLCEAVAPGLKRAGVMLPASGLHQLIAEGFAHPLVATSANLSGEPIITDYTALAAKLGGVYDLALDHNRPIANPCDDSVAQIAAKAPLWLRRARGVMPLKLALPHPLKKPALAVGAHLKSTIAIGFDSSAIIGPFIGDLEGVSSIELFEQSIDRLCGFYRFSPEAIVHDRHTGYASSQWALKRPEPKVAIYHHEAHARAVMAEHRLDEALAVCFDGTGLGVDETLWGGEFLHCMRGGSERIAHLRPLKLIGGEAAIKEIDRIAIALLLESGVNDHPLLKSDRARILAKLHHQRVNTPTSSAAGRLFDGVAVLAGLLEKQSYEGQSGLLLESAYRVATPCSFTLENGVIDYRPTITGLLQTPPEQIPGRFMATLVEMIVTICEPFKGPVVLCGGVFQNRILVDLVYDRFRQIKKPLYLPRMLSPNDSAIAYGQLAAWMEG
jgi:hydrogenase maturation protein HypF